MTSDGALRITALGHAGLKVVAGGATILIDPWFAPDGAFQASWFPWPDNSHLLGPELFRPAAVVISHEHLDHLDPWFLARVPPEVPVVVPRYPSPVLRAKLSAAGRLAVVELDSWSPVDLAEGVRVFFVCETSPMMHDAAIVVCTPVSTLVNLNDARLSPSQLRAIAGALGRRVDALFLQGAGASWFPLCYDYPPERARQLSREKRDARFHYMLRAVETIRPRATFPFAGPPCFLDPELRRFNQERADGIFPDQFQAKAFLDARAAGPVHVLLPGDTWDLARGEREPDPTWTDFAPGALDQYLAAYAERRAGAVRATLERYGDPGRSLWDDFRAYFERLLGLSPYFNEQIGMRVGFDVLGAGGGRWCVDFQPGREAVRASVEGCRYLFRLEARWLAPILRGELLWEDCLLSLRFRAWRDPDRYNEHLFGLLKFAHQQSLDAVEAWERNLDAWARIVVQAGGRSYEVQRYCPHAGVDLRDGAQLLDGARLRCLGHHYEFDLRTGACLNGNCPALEVRLIDAD